jgi:hypothetical protein
MTDKETLVEHYATTTFTLYISKDNARVCRVVDSFVAESREITL